MPRRSRNALEISNTTAADATRKSIRAVGGETRRFVVTGNISVAAGVARFKVFEACVFDGLYVYLGTAPTGANAIVDINKNGTTIFTTQANRPTVAAAANEGAIAAEPEVKSFAAGDVITIDVDQIGSGTPGANLTFELRTRPAIFTTSQS